MASRPRSKKRESQDLDRPDREKAGAVRSSPCSYFLLKSEPSDYSIEALRSERDQTTLWDGVRNREACKILREARCWMVNWLIERSITDII